MSAHLSTSTPAHAPAAAAPSLLRLALRLDAVVTGANGAAYLALAGPLSDLFEVPAAGLRVLGAVLLAFALAVGVLSARPAPATGAVLAVVVANALWALDSVVLLAAGWWSPSSVGAVWVALQAVVVAAFAALQLAGLRRRA